MIVYLVNSTTEHGMLSFLDVFFGYHQIPMYQLDEEKTAFIMPHELFCYKFMSFGLKNARATYQRLMTKIFESLIGRTVEAYIDDVVVKSRTRIEHAQHLEEIFPLMREYNMKLNPAKCTFGVNANKFLGFMVTQNAYRGQSGPNQSCHGNIRPKLQIGAATPHKSFGYTRTLHNLIYRQVKAFFPYTKRSQRDKVDNWLQASIRED